MVGAYDMVALGAFVTTTPGTADTVNVLSSCDTLVMPGTSVTLASVTQGAHGSVTMNDNGTVTYTPNEGFCGTDLFTYTAKVPSGNTSTGTVTEYIITVISGSQPETLWQQMARQTKNARSDMDQLNELKSQAPLLQQVWNYLRGLLQAAIGKGPLAGNPQLTAIVNGFLAKLYIHYQDITLSAANLTSDFRTTRSFLESLPGLYTPPSDIRG